MEYNIIERHYKANNAKEYCKALLDIIETAKSGVIETVLDVKGMNGNYKRKETNLFYVLTLGDKNIIYTDNRYYDSYDDIKNKNIESLKNIKLSYKGIYTNNRLYGEWMIIPEEYKEQTEIPVVNIEEAIKELHKKSEKYLANYLLTTYPSVSSIPLAIINNKENEFPLNLNTEVRKAILDKKDTEHFTTNLPDDLYNIDDLINYDKETTIPNGSPENLIKTKIEKYLKEKYYYNTTRLDNYLTRLYNFYLLRDAVQKNNGYINENDKTFLTIKDAITKFTKEKPNVNNVKIYITGKDTMLDHAVKYKHPNFTIEGKPILISIEPKYLTFYVDINNNEYNIAYHTSKIEYPVLKEKYSNRNINYIDHLKPTDIEKITYGKNIIYKKEKK